MIGDQDDIARRIKSLLPRWFSQDASETPVLDAFLQGPAWALALIYSTFVYARLQFRIRTATDGNLDMIAADFFGADGLPRRPGETDTSYRARILAGVLRERSTKKGIRQIIIDQTGREPLILMEPMVASDGSVWDGPGGYDVDRPYLDTGLAYQGFVTIYRPLPGSPEYGVSDADIRAAVNGVKLFGTTVWVRFLD